MSEPAEDLMSLWDWRRRMSDLYGSIRHEGDPLIAWERWCETRRRLFVSHPQSPIPEAERASYAGPFVFPYDDAARVMANVEPYDPSIITDLSTSDGQNAQMIRAARASFQLFGRRASLDIFWLAQYGGGVYLAFRDVTSGTSTYGGGRYLLDSVKGADLGGGAEHVVLDFNFAYQPSCSYDPRWSCPLPPPQNSLAVDVRAGERSTNA